MLLTKLHIPKSNAKIVHRPHLSEKLGSTLKRKLTLISAPAGYGKTCIICDWLQKNPAPTAWYSLDKKDNDPTNFTNYFIAAIQTIKQDFGEDTKNLFQNPQRPDFQAIFGMLLNELIQFEKDFLFVFDDFHLIDSTEIIEILKYLIEHLPEKIHLIILTRSDPLISISKLRSQEQLVEIRASDLSFSNIEIASLFNKILKINLSPEEIKSIQFKTEGWIAGLQLLALSIKEKEDKSKFISEFAGDSRFIMDYLIEEVLEFQTGETRKFLLQTSVFEQFSGSLCDEVLNRKGSQILIESLEKNNMFIIPLDNERKWFRYHHLFSDLLKQRFFSNYKSEIKNLHQKASDWFYKNNMISTAIEHALEAEDFEKALELLDETVELFWKKGQHSIIKKFGDLLPDQIILKNPELCLFYSRILISVGEILKSEKYLESAYSEISNRLKTELNPDQIKSDSLLFAKINITYTELLSSTGKVDKIFDYCDAAKELLIDEDPLWMAWLWFSYGVSYITRGEMQKSVEANKKALTFANKTNNLFLISNVTIRIAYGELRQGHFHSANEYCSQLTEWIQNSGYSDFSKTEWSFAGLYSIMAYVKFMWHDLNEAEKMAKFGYLLGKKGTDISQSIFSSIVYAKTLLANNNNLNADKIWQELDELYWTKIPLYLRLTFAAFKVSKLVYEDKTDEADKILKNFNIGIDNKKSYANELMNISFSRLLIAKSDFANAQTFLNEIYEIAEKGKRIERTVEIKIIQSILYKTIGEREIALRYLTESLIQAEKENLIMFYVLDKNEIYDLLQIIYKDNLNRNSEIPINFVKTVLTEIDNSNYLNEKAEELLSSRELDVLKEMSENLTNQKVADKLFISLNTVKTHLKNINLKLEVNNRNQAVLKAKEMGLI